MANREKNGKQKTAKMLRYKKTAKKKRQDSRFEKKTANKKNGKKLIRPKMQKKRQKNYHCHPNRTLHPQHNKWNGSLGENQNYATLT